MKKPPALTSTQKYRFHILRQQLFDSCRIGDIENGKKITSDIKQLLLKTGHNMKYYEMLLHYCEILALKKHHKEAISLLSTIVKKTSENTRTYQESNILIAICFVHTHELEKAQMHLKYALDSTAIKNEDRRIDFIKRISERFEEESLLASFGSTSIQIDFNSLIKDIEAHCINNTSENELLESIGKSIPPRSIDFMKRVHDMAKNQLTHQERLMLPPPTGEHEFIKIGKRVFDAFSRRIWLSLCPEESKLRKSIDNIHDPFLVAGAILAEMASQGFSIPKNTILTCATTYILKITINSYCNKYTPKSIMDYRHKRGTTTD